MKGVSFIIFFGFLVFFASCKNVYHLQIIDCKSNSIAKRIVIKEAETFTIKFIHSVEKAPVLESFCIDHAGRIILKEVKFKEIGVGYGRYLPTLYPSEERNGWYYMTGTGVPVRLRYRVGYIANHTLVARGNEYPFSEFVAPGDLVEIAPTLKERIPIP